MEAGMPFICICRLLLILCRGEKVLGCFYLLYLFSAWMIKQAGQQTQEGQVQGQEGA
jgi:hypothetical protein